MSEVISDFAKVAPRPRAQPASLTSSAAFHRGNYERITSDPKYQHFDRIPQRIIRCLDYFQIPVDRASAETTLRAYYLFIGVVDHALDSGESGTAAIVFDRLEGLAADENVSDVSFVTERLICHLPQLSRQTIVRKLRDLYGLVIDEQAATSIESYIDCRKDVGRLTAELSYLLIRPSLDTEHRDLCEFMERVGAVGCLVDSVIDLSADRKKDLLSFEPNLRNHLKLLASTLSEGCAIVIAHPRLIGLFLQAIADNVRDRFTRTDSGEQLLIDKTRHTISNKSPL